MTFNKQQDKTISILIPRTKILLDVLLSTKEQCYDNTPNNLLKKEKRKKRKPMDLKLKN